MPVVIKTNGLRTVLFVDPVIDTERRKT